MKLSFENLLNQDQMKVATHVGGPLLVLAGAGSGKTRSIIFRCAHLIKNLNVAPWNILVVTFTNKAAQELKDRLQDILGFSANNLTVGTFHSVCLNILRREHRLLPFSSNFSIYDDDDQKAVLKKIYKEHGYDPQKYNINRVLGRIGRFKHRLQLPQDIAPQGSTDGGGDPFFKMVLDIYHHYQQALLINQAMDFDDILLYTAKMLQDNESVRMYYADKFRHVMIDEYQDTNHTQFEIIRQIAQDHGQICVVGDDDQAIYSFRGATIRNILEFEKDYPGVQSIRLEQNYRSTMGILHLANAIIRSNKRRHAKDLWSMRGDGIKPTLYIYEDENDEAEKVSQQVMLLQKQGLALSEIAVLYRTNAQSRVFENAFLQHSIPHIIVGSLHFYQRKEIRDFLAYLNMIVNPADSESLLRVINEPPRGIGSVTVGKVVSYASGIRISVSSAVGNASAIPDLNAGTIKKLNAFHELVSGWREAAKTLPAAEMVQQVMDDLQLLIHYRKGNDPKEIARAENLMEFVNSATEYTERFKEENQRVPLLEDFLPFIALQTDLDRVSDGEDALRLMTLHNAKGLEFGHVFIVGLEDELLPHRMSMQNKEDIEEERRLFYVGVTRAKDGLSLSFARQRRLYGTFNHSKASMFLQSLDPSLFDEGTDTVSYAVRPSPKNITIPRGRPKYKSKFTDKDKAYRIGQMVWHEEFGSGRILAVNGLGENALVSVSFANGKLLKIVGSFLHTEPPSSS
ncbi:MAG: UvrD-helicase domain-containing protein [Candidatus Cloacimonadaceae bacterium]